MSYSPVNLKYYLIPLAEINRATENFSRQRCIGGGGFGKVYKGQLSKRWQNRAVAIKRLDRDSHQGEHEFRTELEMISRFHHINIIPFVGYCDEGQEMIIVYAYCVNGSLDHHLQDPNKMRCITWTQRLKICIGVARALNYLHSGLDEYYRVIHRDIKSSNILLDENLVAKVCDFGLSRFGPINLPNTELFTKVAGTQSYLDPTYYESRILRKDSDVYSFGVVLFEMLSGMLVYSERTIEDGRSENLMTLVRRYNQYEASKLIDPDIKVQIHTRSFDIYKEIAYRCVSLNITDRPRMETVIETLEEALDIQETCDTFIELDMEDMGFSYGIPVAAITIYKCLLNWKYLENERTTMFDRLIQCITSAYEDADKYDKMAFWLSNTSSLAFFVGKSLEVDGTIARLFRRLKMGFGLKCDEVNAVVKHIEGKNPAFRFKEQLATLIYVMVQNICSKMEEDLRPLLDDFYIQASVGKDSQSNPGQAILSFHNALRNIFINNCVPYTMREMIFRETFSYIQRELSDSPLLFEHPNNSNLEHFKAHTEALTDLLQYSEAGKENNKHTHKAITDTRFTWFGHKDLRPQAEENKGL